MSSLIIAPTGLQGVKLIAPKSFVDQRGYFMEVWNAREFANAGIDCRFVQINQSSSQQGTLRGLHYQLGKPQGKLVRVVQGHVFDVGVDLRRTSPTFGQWVGEYLSSADRKMLWIPPGFAHGFYVLSETAEIEYCCTELYSPPTERVIAWNDADLNIQWPLLSGVVPIISERDSRGASFSHADVYE